LYQSSNAIALTLDGLPDAKILESIHTHAMRARMLDARRSSFL
jgi:hypothetical protein